MMRLHTEGKYVKNELGQKVFLRGCALIEPAYCIDRLNGPGTLASRAERLKELGVNFVRIPIHKQHWEANTDTNGDGIGNRDFTDRAIQELTSRGIYVAPGLHYGLTKQDWQTYGSNPDVLANWIISNLVNRYKDNPRVAAIYVINEPHFHTTDWGGSEIDPGITTGYWDAMKLVCQRIHEANPNLLMIVHADMQGERGFSSVLRTDPIPTPNVIYTWHYYYVYAPAFNPYLGWMSGVLDPNYQELVNRGFPYYQSYYLGDYTKARQEFEQSLYNRFMWVASELNLPVINDEYGWTGDEEPYFSYRACQTCLENNNGVKQEGVTFWKTAETLDAPGGNPVGEGPYPDVTYCPVYGEPLPRPREHPEPGWPQVMHDFHQILNKYETHWSYYAWWPKTYAGYGLSIEDNMWNLSKTGEIWAQYLTPTPPVAGCFIATAAYGTPLASQLGVLRAFRDECLPKGLTDLYYKISPPIAELIARSGKLRRVTQIYFEPIIFLLRRRKSELLNCSS